MGKKATKNVLVRGVAIVAVLQVVEQLTGLLSQTLLAAWFGASAMTDAYLVGLTVVSLVTLWISHPIARVIVPMFRYDLTREGEHVAWENASVLLNNLTLLFLAVVAVGWIAAPALVGLVGMGFDAETAAVATSVTRILLFGVVFTGAGLFLTQILLTQYRYVLPGSTGIVTNLIAAGGLVLLGSRFGILGVAVAIVAGNVAQLLMQLPVVWRNRHSYRWRIDFRHPGMKELRELSIPVFITAGSVEIDRITDRLFASLLSAGSLSALAFARLLARFPEKMLLHPFQKVTFPHFTTLVAEDDFRALSRQLFQYVRLLIYITIPAAVGMILLDDLIVRTVFKRGAFDDHAVRLTAQALALYAIGIPAAFVGRALTNTFISLKDTRTPMRLSIQRIVVKIVLSAALLPGLGHAGIALAESLSHVVRTALLFVYLPERVRGDELRGTLASFARTVGAATLMGGAVWFLRDASEGRIADVLQLSCLIPLGVGVYLLIGWLSRQSEVEWIGRSLVALTRK